MHDSGGIATRGDKESTLLGAGVGVGDPQVHQNVSELNPAAGNKTILRTRVCTHTHTHAYMHPRTNTHAHSHTCAHSTLCLPLSLSLFLLVTTSLLFSIGFLGQLSHNTHLGRLKQGKSVLSHFWRTEVPTQGGGGQDSLQRTMREDLLWALIPVLSLAIFPSVAILPSLPTRFCPHFLFYADTVPWD